MEEEKFYFSEERVISDKQFIKLSFSSYNKVDSENSIKISNELKNYIQEIDIYNYDIVDVINKIRKITNGLDEEILLLGMGNIDHFENVFYAFGNVENIDLLDKVSDRTITISCINKKNKFNCDNEEFNSIEQAREVRKLYNNLISKMIVLRLMVDPKAYNKDETIKLLLR